MNEREEQRVIEALQALNGGLTVTEQDILVANNKLRDNLEPPSPRRKIVMAAIVAAAAVVAGMVIFQATEGDEGSSAPDVTNEPPTPAEVLTDTLDPDLYGVLPAAAGPAPKMDQLAGAWVMRADLDSALPMLVTGSGKQFLGSPPRFVGSTLSGREWTRETSLEQGCPQTTTYSAGLADNGSLVLQTDDTNCTPGVGLEVWDPITPGSPVANYLVAVSEDADWEGSKQPTVAPGFYVAPRTGHVLLVSVEEGQTSYRYYDSFSGQPTLADRGEFYFEPDALAADCAGGTFSGKFESATLPGVDGFLFPTTAFRVSADNDQCAESRIADQEVWVLLGEHLPS
jgi:hypothetical protein